MTPLASLAATEPSALNVAATATGLTVTSFASWPETDADGEVTPLAGFIESNFSPLLAEVAGRALRRADPEEIAGQVTAIVMVTARGDVTSATRVAAAVDAGRRVSPLLFYQAVPNAVAGYLAARWHLTGPVVCVSGIRAGLEAAALLIDDADADEVLVVHVDLAVADGDTDYAAAILVTGPATGNDHEPDEPEG
jgi:3-oxoacyl-(acyl-carrier-protein) synthase